ncbi:hypothetical protein [Sphingomonas adhaesiva]|uniref:hypothetical protein n=1 Tax=Sphingomonas adhaesiva TaxID=28212 RepID=UPI002FF7DD85
MTTTGRIDHAVLLLQERLRALRKEGGAPTTRAGRTGARQADPLGSLRQLAQQGRIGDEELRKAFVRTLLSESLGPDLLGSIAFQSIADQVLRILEDSEQGRAMIAAALAELGG